tara:strand:- start:441 stop:848 length:408 start_codon:yes stop_codon:yes gene_type:complete
MRDRLWVLIPAAGFPFLLVLFVVLWQSLQQQSRTIQDLGQRLDGLEGIDQRDREGNRDLIEQQLGVLQTRQQTLQRQISNLESWQRASSERERALWNRLDPPFPSNPAAPTSERPETERAGPPALPSAQEPMITP